MQYRDYTTVSQHVKDCLLIPVVTLRRSAYLQTLRCEIVDIRESRNDRLLQLDLCRLLNSHFQVDAAQLMSMLPSPMAYVQWKYSGVPLKVCEQRWRPLS